MKNKAATALAFLVLWFLILRFLPGGAGGTGILGVESALRLGEEAAPFQGAQKLLMLDLEVLGLAGPWSWVLILALGAILAAGISVSRGTPGLVALGGPLLAIGLAGGLRGATPWGLAFALAAAQSLARRKDFAAGFTLGLALWEEPAALILIPTLFWKARFRDAALGLCLGLSWVLVAVLGPLLWDPASGAETLTAPLVARMFRGQVLALVQVHHPDWMSTTLPFRLLPILLAPPLLLALLRTRRAEGRAGRFVGAGLGLVLGLAALVPTLREGTRAPWDLSFGFQCLRLAGGSPLVLGPGPLAMPVLRAFYFRERISSRAKVSVPEPGWLDNPRTAGEWIRGQGAFFFRGDIPDALLSSSAAEGGAKPLGRWFKGPDSGVGLNPISVFPSGIGSAPAFAAYLGLEADARLEADGTPDKARKILAMAEGWAGQEARAWSLISWGWRRAGEPRRGAAAAVRARTLNPSRLEFLLGAAEALDLAGEEEIADAYLMEALGKAPGNPVVLEARAAFFYRHNNPQRAQPFLEAARAARQRSGRR